MRDDLMKMIVHDLKTPLTAVLATTEMLRDGDFGALADPQVRALSATPRRRPRTCSRSSRTCSRSGGWRDVAPRSICNPSRRRPLLAELVHSGRFAFTRTRRRRRWRSPTTPRSFEADKALLKRVFGNLIQGSR